MSDQSDLNVKVCNDRDIIVSKPEAGFEVTYRREAYYPMLIAADVLRNDLDHSKVVLLAQSWKVAYREAKSLGWLDEPEQKRKKKAAQGDPDAGLNAGQTSASVDAPFLQPELEP